jgi:hypothetical protein
MDYFETKDIYIYVCVCVCVCVMVFNQSLYKIDHDKSNLIH